MLFINGRANIFTENFIPDKILHREEQIQEIEKVFKNFSNNLLLMGNSGSGKTSSIKFLMKKFYGRYIYVSALKTSMRTLKELSGLKYRDYGDIFNEFTDQLINNPKIIIIDELNKIKDISDMFDYLNAIYRKTNSPIILISNDPQTIGKMPNDAKLTLFLQRVTFNSYDANELYSIAIDRLKMINIEEKFPEASLRYICAKVASTDNSARDVLFLVFKCIVENDFSPDFIDSLGKKMQEEDWTNWTTSLKEIEKNLLDVLIDISIKNIGKEIISSDLYSSLSNLSPQRISQLITFFVNNGILVTKERNLGRRGGRVRIIEFSSPEIFNKLVGAL